MNSNCSIAYSHIYWPVATHFPHRGLLTKALLQSYISSILLPADKPKLIRNELQKTRLCKNVTTRSETNPSFPFVCLAAVALVASLSCWRRSRLAAHIV